MVLHIRAAQIDEFERSGRRSFARTLVTRLESEFPEVHDQVGPDGAEALAEAALDRAPRFGLVGRRHITAYFDMLALWGPDFVAEQPWARDVLASSAEAQAKVESLYRETKARL